MWPVEQSIDQLQKIPIVNHAFSKMLLHHEVTFECCKQAYVEDQRTRKELNAQHQLEEGEREQAELQSHPQKDEKKQQPRGSWQPANSPQQTRIQRKHFEQSKQRQQDQVE